MSLNLHSSAPPTGARRISLVMLDARNRADRFKGLPAGTAKPLTFLGAFQEAEPYLALPAHAFKLVSWLVKQTMPHDWEASSRPIAWPSARTQAEFLGLSPARVKMLNRALCEANIFVMRDNDQGKRYGRRGPDKRIIEAYGFDLSLLAMRHEEFIRIAAEARTERRRMRDERRRVTLARRSIRQVAELLATTSVPLPAGWPLLLTETADLVAEAAKARRSEDLSRIADAVEARQVQAEQLVRQGSQSVDTNPEGLENKPLSTSTNISYNPSDTVIATEGSSRVARAAPKHPEPDPQAKYRMVVGLKRPTQLTELAPRLESYITTPEPTWADVVAAAGGPLRHELGISVSLWGEACHVMGREAAALALAIVSTKAEGHFTKGAGGYFGGMVRKAQQGQLFLERTLWKLREEKFGRASGSPSRTPH